MIYGLAVTILRYSQISATHAMRMKIYWIFVESIWWTTNLIHLMIFAMQHQII